MPSGTVRQDRLSWSRMTAKVRRRKDEEVRKKNEVRLERSSTLRVKWAFFSEFFEEGLGRSPSIYHKRGFSEQSCEYNFWTPPTPRALTSAEILS